MLRDIINTYRHAFRIYMRQRTRPVTIEEAQEKTLFWSKCYSLSALLGAILATYLAGKHNVNFNYPANLPKEQAILETLSEGTIQVYKFKNFNKLEEYTYTTSTEKEGKKQLSEPKPVETSEV